MTSARRMALLVVTASVVSAVGLASLQHGGAHTASSMPSTAPAASSSTPADGATESTAASTPTVQPSSANDDAGQGDLESAAVTPVTPVAAQPIAPEPVSGRKAVEAMGERLPQVAQLNGFSGAELESLLLSDPEATIMPSGTLYFTESGLVTASASAKPQEALGTQPTLTPAETFGLHSLAGSQHVIYLDFDGVDVTSSMSWHQQVGLPVGPVEGWHPGGGSGSTFTANELAAIHEIWARVSEDFAPFDIDVTTEDPGEEALTKSDSDDQTIGTRVVITGSTSTQQTLCPDGCGGLAMTGVINRKVSDYGCAPFSELDCNDIAWVFPNLLSNETTSIAEAAAHEAGHTFGLVHDGNSASKDSYYTPGLGRSGQPAWSADRPWAPIMGASYFGALSQWSKGDYPNAHNWGNGAQLPLQDDVAIIRSIAGTRDDEGSDTIDTAGGVPSGTAYIASADDVDVYQLGQCTTGATITATPAANGPDLDIALSLLDSSGTVVASSSPVTTQTKGSDGYPWTSAETSTPVGLDAAVTVPADGDPYYVKVDGVGQGTWATGGYDDYASLGAYTVGVTGCTAPAAYVPGSPRKLTVTTLGSGTEADWQAPATDGDSPITGYRVTVGSAAPVDLPATTFRYTDPSATAAPVNVTVTALNAVGAGPAVSGGSVLPQAPSPVLGLNASRPTSSMLVLLWDLPTSGGEIDHLRIEATRGGVAAGQLDDLPAGYTGIGLTGLSDGAWKFKVVAVNDQGEASAAAAVTIITPRAPGRPTAAIARGKRGGKKTVVATWRPGASGTSATTSYVVSIYTLVKGRVKATKRVTVSAGSRRLEVTLKVKKKTTYAVAVQARNKVGTSPISKRTKAVTPR